MDTNKSLVVRFAKLILRVFMIMLITTVIFGITAYGLASYAISQKLNSLAQTVVQYNSLPNDTNNSGISEYNTFSKLLDSSDRPYLIFNTSTRNSSDDSQTKIDAISVKKGVIGKDGSITPTGSDLFSFNTAVQNGVPIYIELTGHVKFPLPWLKDYTIDWPVSQHEVVLGHRFYKGISQ